MTVHFIGAGPGAPDLITVRGRDLVARCPVCLYAGLAGAARDSWRIARPVRGSSTPRRCRSRPSWRSSSQAHAQGQDVARLHSGDLSIWSAMGEQLRVLDERGIPYTMTPGVPSFAAGAAALGRELTLPEVAQSRRADAHLGPRLVDAAARDAGQLRRHGRDAGHPSLHPRAGRAWWPS